MLFRSRPMTYAIGFKAYKRSALLAKLCLFIPWRTVTFRWLDQCFSSSIYGLILLFGYSESDILEILDFSSERHAAEILLLEESNSVDSICINWAQIKCNWSSQCLILPSTNIQQFVFLKKNQEFQGCHFLNIQIKESAHKWSLMKHQSRHLKAKS